MSKKLIFFFLIVFALCAASLAFAEGGAAAAATDSFSTSPSGSAGICPPMNVPSGEYAICLSPSDNKVHVYQNDTDLGAVATKSVVSSLVALKAQPAGSNNSFAAFSRPNAMSNAPTYSSSLAVTPDAAEASASSASQQNALPPGQEKPKRRIFNINDNMFNIGFGSWYRDPFIAEYDNTGKPIKALNIGKWNMEFKHVDVGNKWGDNTFVVDYLSSDRANPVSTDHFHSSPLVGAKDAYFVYRHAIVMGRALNKNFSKGIIQDWTINVGFDYGSKNDDFSNQRRSPMVGAGLQFKVPNHGYWNVAAMWTKEWNNEGTDVTEWRYCNTTNTACQSTQHFPYVVPYTSKWGQPIDYANTYTIQTNWGIPFALGKALMSFEGFATFNGTKGYGAPELGANQVWTQKGTKPELIIRPVLNLNVGRFLDESHIWTIGVGYEYWNNLFGVDHHKYLGALQNAPFVQLGIHF